MATHLTVERTPGWARIVIALLVTVVVLLLLPWIYMLTFMLTHGPMPMTDAGMGSEMGGMMDGMRGMMGR